MGSAESLSELRRRLLPVHIGDLCGGAEVRRRIAMAIQAPAHAELFDLSDDFHLVNATVAAHAADSASHVSAMIEVNVVR